MGRILKVSRSGYYKWLSRKESVRKRENERVKILIRGVHENSRGTYGPNRIKAELAAQGHQVGRDRIIRLRKEMGLRCVQKRKYKATTNSRHTFPVAPNLLDQHFRDWDPGEVWGTDLTYVATDEGWVYLAGVKDLGSREMVGYAFGSRMTQELTREALRQALGRRTPRVGCIHHSDRGSQYCAHAYQNDVRQAGMKPSMSRKGNCFDNAPTESFWGTIKQELIYHRTFRTRAEAIAAVREYIEIFYNRMRRHSAIGYVAPSIYAERFLKKERRTA